MKQSVLLGIDYVAITVADVEVTWAFYERLFGTEIINEYAPGGRPAVRVFLLGGGARLSVHQAGNGVDLVAALPTPGSADICFRWGGSINEAQTHLAGHGVAIVDGPSPRRTLDGLPAHSVYFRDPDGNLIELMAAN
ncbi:VOC family protein [Novosphingobium sp. G106]|uniref:VOC family protein n=1 Tax=Novosphingobium sp. G106 TaxID=2849500 RepID=UPI001C2CE2F6|nr:VOC family protein [Novosphingobium sp. G106]MBV1687854.1 VOC family protein [Novosphingobium sp. G106]